MLPMDRCIFIFSTIAIGNVVLFSVIQIPLQNFRPDNPPLGLPYPMRFFGGATRIKHPNNPVQ